MTTPITIDLQVHNQGMNIDIESIAPVKGFNAESYDVANMTITATVESPTEATYRLVLAADTEAGTSAFVRVVSGTKDHFKDPAPFNRIPKKDAEIIRPVLAKAGITLDSNVNEKKQLEELANGYKVADLKIPAGRQVLRIHASQKLLPQDGDPRKYRFVMYAPQLSLAPVSNVRLGATVIFPLDFNATIDTPVVEALPNQPVMNPVAGSEVPVQVGAQTAYGWAFQADPKITFTYTYTS
jgi:hypothetical protein